MVPVYNLSRPRGLVILQPCSVTPAGQREGSSQGQTAFTCLLFYPKPVATSNWTRISSSQINRKSAWKYSSLSGFCHFTSTSYGSTSSRSCSCNHGATYWPARDHRRNPAEDREPFSFWVRIPESYPLPPFLSGTSSGPKIYPHWKYSKVS